MNVSESLRHAHPPRRRPLALALLLASAPALAQQPPDVAGFEQRLRAIEQRLGVASATPSDAATVADLDQRLRVIERRLELQAEEAASKAATASSVALSAGKGLSVKSPASDGVELKLRGLVQADARVFLDDERVPQNDTFLFRRIRPSLEGSWGPLVAFRLTPEFAGDSATVIDAYVDLKFDPRATLRIGKVKGPVGLERLQSASALALAERGFATELAPNRDLGVQLQGELLGGELSYAVGAFNGAPDGRDSPTTNPDDHFEGAARVFWEPFRNDANAWSGLGVGIATSVGDKTGAGNGLLPRYRTPGQVQFFGYAANVAADGLHRRWSPQGYVYRGPFGLQGEFITSEQEVRVASGANAGRVRHLQHEAWNVTASWVLTGEDAGFRGLARPNQPFTVGAAGWGAFEVVARYGELDVDDAAFPLFASAAASASRAQAWGVGLNWYLTQNLKLVANYTHTAFDGGAPSGADREDETLFTTRAQLSF